MAISSLLFIRNLGSPTAADSIRDATARTDRQQAQMPPQMPLAACRRRPFFLANRAALLQE
jgi:hypothetical protein